MKMASEHNDIRRQTNSSPIPSAAPVMAAAGRLCALALLSDAQAFTLDPYEVEKGLIRASELPADMVGDARALTECLNSKLFVAEGKRRTPRHRTIAEHLAARALADKIARGLQCNGFLP